MISLIPISDANPTRRTPYVTIGLIIANALAFFFLEPSFGTGIQDFKYFVENAPLPCQASEAFDLDEAERCPVGTQPLGEGVTADVPDRGVASLLGAVLLATFLHAGWLHIIGNMLFLWVFGNNIEDYLGGVKYIGFYVLGGVAAAFAHIFMNLSDFIPTVGASGAVAAVMGAYLVLYPRARVNTIIPLFVFFTVVQLSALVVLGIWFVYQFVIAAQSSTAGGDTVAWMAHVGGFVFGVIAIFLMGGRPQPARYEFGPGGPWRSRRTRWGGRR